MAKSSLTTTFYVLVLTLALVLASQARVLNQVPDPFTQDGLPTLPSVSGSGVGLPSGQTPIMAPVADTTMNPDEPLLNPEAPIAPTPYELNQPQPDLVVSSAPDVIAPIVAPYDGTTIAPNPEAPIAPTSDELNQPQPDSVVSGAHVVAPVSGLHHPTISFYMHDVLGGSQASGRIVTGIVATEGVNGIPFSKPNNQIFPVSNGVPLTNNGNINNLFSNNNAPSLASLNGQRSQNTGTNGNQAFVTSGTTLQKLMFGSTTVIDDELTEGHELGSAVLGRGQGFYLASSLDGESHTMAFTALFHEEVDTISFFGIHRTASPMSQIAVIGGTGKYDNAKGYATIETLPQENQHTTDGVDTIAQINVYLD